MAVPVWKHGLCYYPVPKAANTSIKHALHVVRTGEKFVNSRNDDGSLFHIHHAYATPRFNKVDHELYGDLLRFAVVRDPVERLLSVWGNRVKFHLELSEKSADAAEMKRRELIPDPDLATFVDRLEDYVEVSASIKLHAAPMVAFLGPKPDFFHLLFHMKRLGELESFLAIASGRRVKFPHLQAGGPKATREDLTADRIRKLEAYYARDYEVFERPLASAAAGVRKPRRGVAAAPKPATAS